MTSVFDPFEFNQSDSTTVGPGDWTPVGNRTTNLLGGSGIMNIDLIILNQLFISFPPPPPPPQPPPPPPYPTIYPVLRYTFPATDFTSMVNIILQGVIITSGVITFNLILYDNTAANFKVAEPLIAGNVVWTVADFGVLDLENIVQMDLSFESVTAVQLQADSLISTLVCVARDTMIKVPGGTMMIQDLKRGDEVLDPDGKAHPIARVLHTKCLARHKIDIVEIQEGSIETDIPNRLTLISGWHPILYQGVRKPAKCFVNFPGVKHSYHTITAGEILPMHEESYSLFNLQFDHEVFFIANNMTVQAVSPYSRLVPLPQKLFFTQSEMLPLVNESYITETAWNDEILEANAEN